MVLEAIRMDTATAVEAEAEAEVEEGEGEEEGDTDNMVQPQKTTTLHGPAPNDVATTDLVAMEASHLETARKRARQ